MRVSELWRFPVKSMAGEQVGSVRITEETGVLGDRSYALLDVATGRIASAKHPRLWGPLLGYQARVVEGDGQRHPVVSMRLPDGRTVRSDAIASSGFAGARSTPGGSAESIASSGFAGARSTPGGSAELIDVDRALSAAIGRDVKLVATPPPQASYDEYQTTLDDSTGEPLAVGAPAGTFFDFASLHILTTGTLAQLTALRPESRFELARFRPNIVVDTGDATFHENAWIGHELAIGDEVRAYVTFPCPRCVMTTLAQGDVPADPEILKIATANTLMFPLLRKKLPSVGVYATVVRGGVVKPGDAVRVLATSALRRVGTYAHAIKRAIRRR